ncbi:MAG: 30S ribosome-binding factor RbfA [Caulobacterales bacterium]
MSKKSGYRAKPTSPHGAKGPTQRQLQAGELVRHALADILRREDLRDPALYGVSITLSEARMSPDLRNATVFCAPLGGGSGQTIADGLNRCAGFLRGRLGKEIDLRFTPHLNFLPDQSFAVASHIESLLSSDEVRRDLQRQRDADAEKSQDDGQDS